MSNGASDAQSAFQNLDFEAAAIPPGTPPSLGISPGIALPGWSISTMYLGYDAASGGGAAISVIDRSAGFAPLQGSFSVILYAGSGTGVGTSSFISQTGLVPANAQSILMDIAFPFGNTASTRFTVALGGQQIAMAPYQIFANYTVYAGDISTEAGQPNDALTIAEYPPAPPTVPPSSVELDNIVFSPNAVPEPAAWTLFLYGAVLLGVMRQFHRP